MQLLFPSSYRALAATLIGLGIFGRVALGQESAVAPGVHRDEPNTVIENCDDTVSQCASEFEKIVTVYEHNVTTAQVHWVTIETTLEPTTVTSTSVVVTTKKNETKVVDALCEKTFVVTRAGTSIVTVHLNATHIVRVQPTETTTTTSTITQYAQDVSVCLIQGTYQPLRPAAPRAAEPRQPERGADRESVRPASSASATQEPRSSAAAEDNDDNSRFASDTSLLPEQPTVAPMEGVDADDQAAASAGSWFGRS